tara:strand:+ start:27796 stop:30090 length:2295 start_codon:yes stop_codon:yes gene_type:complete
MKFSNPFKVALLSLFVSFSLSAQDSYWTLDTDKETKIGKKSTQNNTNLDAEKYQIFTLDVNALKTELKKGVTSKSSPVISFPNQYGELETFSVVETHVLAPHVAAKFPNIKTYIGYGIDNPGSRIRFSVSPQGVQTMTSYIDKPAVFTVPQGKNTTSYISYDKSARKEYVKDFQCLTDDLTSNNGDSGRDMISRPPNDQLLRTFRLAVSTTGEYTTRWDDGDNTNGDAKVDALAQIVSTVNRMNEVFELDMAITFQLVTGTEVVFDDAVSDPYTGDLNSEVQSTLTSNVGEANYDIGHLFHQGGNNGNAGCIGCVCEDGNKGSAFSSHTFAPDIDGNPYMTDYFDIDYVPHEVGHQMGGNHTWSFGSEGTGVNVEPGSGTTIMGYAGITGLDDVQFHSDPYFHYSSVEQILNNILGSPNNCWTSSPIGNVAPVANAGSDYTIPAGTAFVLKGAATTTGNIDNIRYIWEQIDDGVSTSENFGPTKADGATFRSRPPSTNPNRYMPTLSRIIAGKLTEEDPRISILNDSWETVSTVTRQLNFALTVRDQIRGKGNLPQTDSDLMRILVFDTAGPFVVTSQTTAVTWTENETKTVAWDVAGTDTGNVNTPTVNILLSIDGGNTYPYTLASNVANDGSHDVTVPNISTMSVGNARVMVEGNGNIFFAINSSDFTVQNATASVDEDVLSSFSMYPNPSNGLFNVSFDTTDKDVSIQVSDLKGAVIKNVNYRNVGGRFSEKVELNALSKGLYILRITNGEKSVAKKIIIE